MDERKRALTGVLFLEPDDWWMFGVDCVRLVVNERGGVYKVDYNYILDIVVDYLRGEVSEIELEYAQEKARAIFHKTHDPIAEAVLVACQNNATMFDTDAAWLARFCVPYNEAKNGVLERETMLDKQVELLSRYIEGEHGPLVGRE